MTGGRIFKKRQQHAINSRGAQRRASQLRRAHRLFQRALKGIPALTGHSGARYSAR